MSALSKCKLSQRDYVIEVESSIRSNSNFHRFDFFSCPYFLILLVSYFNTCFLRQDLKMVNWSGNGSGDTKSFTY